MASRLKNLVDRFTPSSSRKTSPKSTTGTAKTPDARHLFPVTNPLTDGDECLHDCQTCTIHLPSKFSIDTDDKLYGHINAWHTHMLVATGQTDWVKDVADVKGSVMEAVGKHGQDLSNGKLMLSACNMPPPDASNGGLAHDEKQQLTTVLLLPRFEFVTNVTPAATPALLDDYIAHISTNASPLTKSEPADPILTAATAATPENLDNLLVETTPSNAAPAPTLSPSMSTRSCPHQYLILLCSQKTRDARCGQSAPLLRRELERHLRPLGLYRDLQDERPGGVGIYFISHVGGHKYSANMMIYRRAGSLGADLDGDTIDKSNAEAAQCIWMARVRPEDCENIVRYTVLQGKIVKPDHQLRGGFDRTRGLTSW